MDRKMWSVEFGSWSLECVVRNVECGVCKESGPSSVECAILDYERGVWTVGRGV